MSLRTTATMKIEGLRELEQKLVKLGAEMAAEGMARAGVKGIEPVLEEAKRLAPEPGPEHPYSKGRIRNALRVAIIPGNGRTSIVDVGLTMWKKKMPREVGYKGGVGGARHWHFIEFGVPARGFAPMPFLRPAADAQFGAALEIVKKALAEEVARATGAAP